MSRIYNIRSPPGTPLVNDVKLLLISDFNNVLLQKHVLFFYTKDVVSIDSITFVLFSCYDYDAQTDAQLA